MNADKWDDLKTKLFTAFWVIVIIVGLANTLFILYAGIRWGFGDFSVADNGCANEACAEAYLDEMGTGPEYRGP